MKKFIIEDTAFKITVVDGKTKDDGAIDCRNGHEMGESYYCTYGCPEGFCQKTMVQAFAIMEVARAGGDLRKLGGDSASTIHFCCPDGVVTFYLEVIPINE